MSFSHEKRKPSHLSLYPRSSPFGIMHYTRKRSVAALQRAPGDSGISRVRVAFFSRASEEWLECQWSLSIQKGRDSITDTYFAHQPIEGGMNDVGRVCPWPTVSLLAIPAHDRYINWRGCFPLKSRRSAEMPENVTSPVSANKLWKTRKRSTASNSEGKKHPSYLAGPPRRRWCRCYRGSSPFRPSYHCNKDEEPDVAGGFSRYFYRHYLSYNLFAESANSFRRKNNIQAI